MKDSPTSFVYEQKCWCYLELKLDPAQFLSYRHIENNLTLCLYKNEFLMLLFD